MKHPYREAPSKVPIETIVCPPGCRCNDLHVFDIKKDGIVVRIAAQNPELAPDNCPQCGEKMKDNYIGCNASAHYYVRACECNPFVVWNASRWD